MPKLIRYDLDNHIYFVTSKTKHNKRLFLDASRAELFIKVLFECRERYGFLLLGFVVMPDHFHALIMPMHGHAISAVVQKIKSLFAYRLRATGMTGSIWQKSFYDFVVYSEGKLREKVDYIHANPVRKGIAQNAHEYRFSSINYLEEIDRFA